jgi:hypothetical protein
VMSIVVWAYFIVDVNIVDVCSEAEFLLVLKLEVFVAYSMNLDSIVISNP